jgi:hypothetical protein
MKKNAYAYQLGDGHQLLWEDDNMLWGHDGHNYWIPVDVKSGIRHRVTYGTPESMNEITIEGAFGCPDCGVRGYVQGGKWVPLK